ncbi:RHTO0S10e04434g1_1 [Rhodotorula toruloides]|uniref:Mitochondrial import inner membrane translocase subunit TIM22 n=2 Tax=Rhodotorula toruloides TaxID=5286 RepID=A0A061B541_RHOTO|nr:mitochondrial import inner membrane translocase subunit TIM22 [Rhodotorula toruloides NP11]EMS22805.1 mitochondrial import inner membrane translocase subunit TIM22 [Rhodotorula toruloides NP11]CDR45042.1 RHTO0S10e04434g1_1 [Rhodotorula toruloides]
MATQYLTPFVVPGYEPPSPDPETGEVRTKTEDERREIISQMKQIRLVQEGMESPVAKAAISGAMGFGIGAFFSLMGSSFTIEDPLQREQYAGMNTRQKAKVIFGDMGKSMWRQGKGFGMVGALYAGTECIVEGFRAKNDIYNSIYAGLISGAVLARNSGPRAMVLGGMGFAAFSAAIDSYMRRDTPDEDA